MTFSCILISRRVLNHAGLTRFTKLGNFANNLEKGHMSKILAIFYFDEISQFCESCQSGMIEDPPGNQNAGKGHIW